MSVPVLPTQHMTTSPTSRRVRSPCVLTFLTAWHRPFCASLPRLLHRLPSSRPSGATVSRSRAPWRMSSSASTSTVPTSIPPPTEKPQHVLNSSMFANELSFSMLGVSDQSVQALSRHGILTPTRVQAAVIPAALEGLSMQAQYASSIKEANIVPSPDYKHILEPDFGLPEPPQNDISDVLMIGAETGSGKTLSYLLPYVETLRTSHPDLKAIIMVPSRELCWQISQLLNTYFEDAPLSLVLAGGSPPDVSDVKAVKVVIATPSALLNYFRFTKNPCVSDKMIIVDEADMLLSGGFLADIERILDQPGMKPFATRKNGKLREINRNRLFFVGATYPHWTGEKVRSIITWMKRRYPGVKALQTQNIHKHGEKLQSRWFFEPKEEKRLDRLLEILKTDSSSTDKIMVFGSGAESVQRIAEKVEQLYGKEELEAKFGCALQLHKRVGASERFENLQHFRAGEARLLFCTDLGSRGLDLGDVTRVVEFDFASNVVSFLHRIGRTARAGAEGFTDHLYDEVSQPLAEAIKKRADTDVTVVEGIFSRNRSFRRKLKKQRREQLSAEANANSEKVVPKGLEDVEIDEPDEEELERFDL